jgi:hypothetical protein
MIYVVVAILGCLYCLALIYSTFRNYRQTRLQSALFGFLGLVITSICYFASIIFMEVGNETIAQFFGYLTWIPGILLIIIGVIISFTKDKWKILEAYTMPPDPTILEKDKYYLSLFIAAIWVLASLALLTSSIIELRQIMTNPFLGPRSRAFYATLTDPIFALLCITGSVLLMKKSNAGRIILIIASCLTLLYALAYTLMGGIEDRSKIYTLTVIGFAFFSILSLIILWKSQTTQQPSSQQS